MDRAGLFLRRFALILVALAGIDSAHAATVLCARVSVGGGGASNVVSPTTGTIYTLDSHGCASFSDADAAYFMTQGYLPPPGGQPSSGGLPNFTNALTASIPMTPMASYTDGPAVAQGNAGTWFVSGSVTLVDTAGGATLVCKLWDGGAGLAASSSNVTAAAGDAVTVGLSGIVASPTGNLRISCRDDTSGSGQILSTAAGNTKSSVIAAIRID